jgi:ATP dependent DNA ligase-like protein
MTAMAAEDALQLARDLRLQWFGRASSDRIAEPVVEPLWSGLRVVAAAQDGQGVLLEDGAEVTTHPHLAESLARTVAATASGVILDAYVTKQIASEEPGVGVYTGVTELPTAGNMLMGSLVGRGRRPRRQQLAEDLEAQLAQQRFDEDEPVNLVAVDLLWLDGEWLLEAPLLERKRLLEAVLPGDPLVRSGVYVRPPIERWVGSWRAQGFRGLAFKGANSRYRPGEVANDWTTRPMPRR